MHAPPDKTDPLGAPKQERVLVTGSRIPQPIDEQDPRSATISPVRIYSRQDLDRTGRIGVAAGLRALDPGVGR